MDFREALHELASLVNYFGRRRYIDVNEDKNEMKVYCSDDICFVEGSRGIPEDLETCKCVIVRAFKHKLRVKYDGKMVSIDERECRSYDDAGFKLMQLVDTLAS